MAKKKPRFRKGGLVFYLDCDNPVAMKMVEDNPLDDDTVRVKSYKGQPGPDSIEARYELGEWKKWQETRIKHHETVIEHIKAMKKPRFK